MNWKAAFWAKFSVERKSYFDNDEGAFCEVFKAMKLNDFKDILSLKGICLKP